MRKIWVFLGVSVLWAAGYGAYTLVQRQRRSELELQEQVDKVESLRLALESKQRLGEATLEQAQKELAGRRRQLEAAKQTLSQVKSGSQEAHEQLSVDGRVPDGPEDRRDGAQELAKLRKELEQTKAEEARVHADAKNLNATDSARRQADREALDRDIHGHRFLLQDLRQRQHDLSGRKNDAAARSERQRLGEQVQTEEASISRLLAQKEGNRQDWEERHRGIEEQSRTRLMQLKDSREDLENRIQEQKAHLDELQQDAAAHKGTLDADKQAVAVQETRLKAAEEAVRTKAAAVAEQERLVEQLRLSN